MSLSENSELFLRIFNDCISIQKIFSLLSPEIALSDNFQRVFLKFIASEASS